MQKQNTIITPIQQFMQELFWKSIYTFLSLALCFCICFRYADVFLFHHAVVCFKVLPNIIPSFLTLDVTEALQSMILISIYICSMCLFPIIYYFILTFILPSCFETEIQYIYIVSIGSILSSIFAYVVTMHLLVPNVIHFFLYLDTNMAPTWHHVPRLIHYISFIITFSIAMQIVSQLPWISLILYKIWPFPIQVFNTIRKYIHVGALCLSAFLCPPDLYLQLYLWVVFVVCIEIMYVCICIASMYVKRLTKGND